MDPEDIIPYETVQQIREELVAAGLDKMHHGLAAWENPYLERQDEGRSLFIVVGVSEDITDGEISEIRRKIRRVVAPKVPVKRDLPVWRGGFGWSAVLMCDGDIVESVLPEFDATGRQIEID